MMVEQTATSGMYVVSSSHAFTCGSSAVVFRARIHKAMAKGTGKGSFVPRRLGTDQGAGGLCPWSRAEIINAGMVTSSTVKSTAREVAWIAEGTFSWRSTRLRVAWSAAHPC
jgi:hypothetical protein